MKLLLLPMLALSFSAQAFAGSANAEFECVSASGRTLLKASVPGDYAEHDVDFSIDGKSLRWTAEDSVIDISGELQKQNYKFVVTEADHEARKVVIFEAIPGTANIKTTGNGEAGSLRARVYGEDPRNNQPSKVIEVKCKYRYEI